MSDTISLTEWAVSLPDTGDTTIAAKVLKGLVEERDELRERLAEETKHSEAQAEQIARLTAELQAADYHDHIVGQYPI